MSKSTLGKGLAALMLGVSGLLAPVGQAGAAVFIGAFDPDFGPAYESLGFSGQATFSIADACLGASPAVNGSPSGCSMSVVSATVDLYRVPATSVPPQTIKQAFFSPPPPELLSSAYFAGSTLLGVNTDQIALKSDGETIITVDDHNSDSPIYSGPLWLQFVYNPIPFESDYYYSLFAIAPVPSAFLFACDPEAAGCDTRVQSNAALVRFTQVPEPATLALVLSALAVAVFTRRRHSSVR